MFVPLSVLEFRDRAETYFGDKVGVIDGDKRFTYREFGERTHRLANALRELGVAARRSGHLHHLQHASAARGLLRCARGGRDPQPDQHPPDAARDRLHRRPRRLEGRLLPPATSSRSSRRSIPELPGKPRFVDHGRRARRRRRATSTRLCSAARLAGPAASPRSTRTRWPSSSTRAAPPASRRASR